MVNKTLGIGGDYSNWTDVVVALQGLTLTDDWTISQISDFTLSSEIFGNEVSISALNLNGHVLRFTSRSLHNGDPTTGFKINVNYANQRMLITANLASGTLQFDSIHFSFNTNTNGYPGIQISASNFDNTATVITRDCLFINTFGGVAFNAIANSSRFIFNTYNCVFYGCHLSQSGALNSSKTENITCIGGQLLAHGSKRNCYATSFTEINNQDHNASEDTTSSGTGSIDSVIRANQFLSTDPASPNFLKLAPGSVLIGAGAAPSIVGNALGIRGNARPGADSVSCIGSDEVDALGQPYLIAPLSGSMIRLGDPVLVWSETNDSIYYEVHIARDVEFLDRVVRLDVLGAEIQYGLPFGGTYFWKARAVASPDYSDFTETWTFTVPPLLPDQVPDHDGDGRSRLLTQFREDE